jgi:hypothetical protein
MRASFRIRVKKKPGGKETWWKRNLVEKKPGGKETWWKRNLVEKKPGGKETGWNVMPSCRKCPQFQP